MSALIPEGNLYITISITIDEDKNIKAVVNRDSTYLDKYAQLRYEDLGSFFTSLSDALDDEALTR